LVSIYDFEVEKINGEKILLKEYEGKVMMIVNTASKCGFTPQFKELQSLYEEYKEKDFVTLGFPCDQFMNQEFDNDEEIIEFCQVNYGVTFPMFSKIKVKGKEADPLYQYLIEQKKGLLIEGIKWNFTKFLIDRNGEVYKRYSPQTSPNKIKEDIERLLVV
jgi:glutathione peroxidase